MRVAVIDADTILWVACYLANKDSLTEEQAKEALNTYLATLFRETRAEKYVGFLGSKESFRKRMFPDYKANRPPVPDWIIKWKPILKEHLLIYWKFVETVDGFEADDAVASVVETLQKGLFVAHTDAELQPITPIVCSPDKDLKQIAGEHFNTKSMGSSTVTEQEALFNLSMQILHGDVTDNIKPVKKGFGPVKARKVLESEETLGLNPLAIALGVFVSEHGEYEGLLRFAENSIKATLKRDFNYQFILNDVPGVSSVSSLFQK